MFLAYGATIPIAAFEFLLRNAVATSAMIAVCFVIAALLWSRRAVFLNILLAFYLLRVYLTRPYVDVFLSRLTEDQLYYISSNNFFYNSADATVVYLSLLSLVVAWYLGLLVVRPNSSQDVVHLRIFRWTDRIIIESNWRFWLVWSFLTLMNYQSASVTWQGIATGSGKPLFAYGLFSTVTINYACLFAFLQSRALDLTPPSKILIAPVFVAAVFSILGGSRSFLFTSIILFVAYWVFLNYNKRIAYRDILQLILLACMVPYVIFFALLAQSIRPLLIWSADPSIIANTLLEGLNVFNQNNPLYENLFFGVSELVHRLSSLQAQFLILNNHFFHDPWETFNPVQTFMRVVNDLVPGDVFDNVLSINRLFSYIYRDQLITYSSETWSIQGTLYLYFGFWVSPVIVFLVAYAVGRYSGWLDGMVRASPSFAIFFALFANDLVENGTLERVIPVDLVRPLASFFGLIAMVGLLHILFSVRGLGRDFSLNSLRKATTDMAKRWGQ